MKEKSKQMIYILSPVAHDDITTQQRNTHYQVLLSLRRSKQQVVTVTLLFIYIYDLFLRVVHL